MQLRNKWKVVLAVPAVAAIGIYSSLMIASSIQNSDNSRHEAGYAQSFGVAAEDLVAGFGRAISPSVIASFFSYNYPLDLNLFEQASLLEFQNAQMSTIAYVVRVFPNETHNTEVEFSKIYDRNISLSYIDNVGDILWVIYYTYPFVDIAIGLHLNSEVDRALAISDMFFNEKISVTKPLEIGTGDFGIFSLEPVHDFNLGVEAFVLRLFTVEDFLGSDVFGTFIASESVPHQISIDGHNLVQNSSLAREKDTLVFSGEFEGIEIIVTASSSPGGDRQNYYEYLLSSGLLVTVLVVVAILLNIKATIAAEKTVELKGRFITDMSHEIRTPMNGVLGSAEILMGYPMEDPLVKYVNIIKSCGETLLNIVNDILDMSKIEAGMMDICSAEFDMISTTVQVVRDTKVSFEPLGDRVKTSIDICRNFPRHVVGDSVRYRQVLSDIYTNALKFTDRGEIKICVRCKPISSSDVLVEISVSDTGIGMSEKNTTRCFEAFVQLHPPTRDVGGTGLGLSVCKKLVHLMGGTVSCKSKIAEGSTFTFRIRLGGTLHETPPDENHKWVLSSDNKINGAILKSSRSDSLSSEGPETQPLILVVDDNKINRIIASKVLESMGVPSLTADNGVQAIEKSESTKFSIILMVMPVMDGETATRTIRASTTNLNRETPILFLTANVGKQFHELCINSGGNAVITKPVNKRILMTSVTTLLKQQEATWVRRRYNSSVNEGFIEEAHSAT